jgi:MYXO-CTERM domain-containing protein
MFSRSVARVGIASLLGMLATFGAVQAEAASSCDTSGLTCARGTTALRGAINSRLPTVIDSGVMEKGSVKIRARFTIDPVQGEPLFAIDMPRGAVVEASWTASEKGTIALHPITESGAEGSVKVHYTLIPNIEATLFGVTIKRDASDLIDKIPGSAFHYDEQGTASVTPWGFAGASATPPAPALDDSTLFSLPFTDLGLGTGVAEGILGIQASARPTFKYTTKSIQFDSASLTSPDGTAKIAVGDADAIDVSAKVLGEVALDGDMDIRPVVKADSIGGIPTFGLTKFSFSAVKKSLAGSAPSPVQFDNARIHIPLPNVKVPSSAVGVGSAKAGEALDKSVTIQNTGELGGVMRITSSDPQFVVPSGDVRIDPKGSYDLAIRFQPASDGPASATITVKSNDPDSPEQTFQVGANGASVGDDAEETDDAPTSKGRGPASDASASDGCAVAAAGAGGGTSSAVAGFALALGALLAGRRRR